MDKIYVIKTIGNDGIKAWFIDTPNGIKISIDGVSPDITNFRTYNEANDLIKNGLDIVGKKPANLYIHDNDDLLRDTDIKKGIATTSEPMYYLQDKEGKKVFYNARSAEYYWSKYDVGFCLWRSTKALNIYLSRVNFAKPIAIQKIEKCAYIFRIPEPPIAHFGLLLSVSGACVHGNTGPNNDQKCICWETRAYGADQ